MALEGMQLGRYRILSLIGSGNMGEVYLAEDTLLNRQVAIKLIRTEGSSYPNPEAVKESERLFQREAKAIAALDHPNILPLYDYGEQIVNGAPTTYMVMPLRKDGSFATWLQQRGTSNLLSFEEVGYFVRHAADALQHAHNHQVTHQDVKPSNFLIQRNEQANRLPNLQLGDFGIAKFTTGTAGGGAGSEFRDTEIAQLQIGQAVSLLVTLDQEVGWFHILMRDLVIVSMLQSICRMTHKISYLFERKQV